MIRLTYAHRWTPLIDALAERLLAARASLGALEPLTVIVPHGLATSYLKLALADRIGIAANLRFSYLRPFAADAYERSGACTVLTPARLEHLLLVALDRIDREGLAPVQRYLAAEGPTERRRAQLAKTLTLLFDEYTLTRPQMLRAWATGELVSDDPENERWQATLWSEVRAYAATLDGPPLVTLDEVLDAPFRAPPVLFVFDVLLGTPVLQTVLARWSAEVQIDVFATNPCMEFWEDLPAGGRTARDLRATLLPKAEGQWSAPNSTDDPLALLLWGRPGRENVRLLNHLTDCDFDGRFAGTEATPPTFSVVCSMTFSIARRPTTIRRSTPTTRRWSSWPAPAPGGKRRPSWKRSGLRSPTRPTAKRR